MQYPVPPQYKSLIRSRRRLMNTNKCPVSGSCSSTDSVKPISPLKLLRISTGSRARKIRKSRESVSITLRPPADRESEAVAANHVHQKWPALAADTPADARPRSRCSPLRRVSTEQTSLPHPPACQPRQAGSTWALRRIALDRSISERLPSPTALASHDRRLSVSNCETTVPTIAVPGRTAARLSHSSAAAAIPAANTVPSPHSVSPSHTS